MSNKFYAVLQGTNGSLVFIKEVGFTEDVDVMSLLVTSKEKAFSSESEEEVIQYVYDQFNGAIPALIAEYDAEGNFVGVRPPIRTNA